MTVQIHDREAAALRQKQEQEATPPPKSKTRSERGTFPDKVTYSWMPKGAYFDLAGQG